MRKNKMMRAASALLVAVLLTTSTISGTFAKYVTQDSASDTARVAKWGVELQVIGNLYGDSYGSLTDGVNKIVEDGDDSISVQSVNYAANTDDVVAPGTKNDEGFSIVLAGSPEVDGVITSEMTFQNIFLKEGTYGVMIKVPENTITEANFDEYADELYTLTGTTTYSKVNAWAGTVDYYTLEDEVTLNVDSDNSTNDAAYYPVVYTLTGNTNTTGTTYTADSLKAVADAIKDQLDDVNSTVEDDLGNATVKYANTLPFDSNTNLAGFKLDNLEITWAWAFERKDGSTVIPMYDGADTILGMLIAKEVAGTAPDTDNYTVVKLTDADNRIFTSELAEFTDYCLDTKFDLLITVTQTAEDSGL